MLHGTTSGSFTAADGSGPVLQIAGTVTFTTHQGTAIVTVSGTLDTSTGAFRTSGPVTGSSGKLAGATGSLMLEGTENLVTGAFVESVTGSLCVDLAP